MTTVNQEATAGDGRRSYRNPTCLNGIVGTNPDLVQDLALFQQVGTDRIGLALHKLEAYGHQRSMAAIGDSGAQIGYVVHPFKADPTDVDGRVADRQGLLTAVEVAAQVGAGIVYFTSGPSGQLTWDQAADRLVELIAPVVQRAGELGVAVAVENTQPVRCDLSFTHSARDAMTLARMAGIGICLDLYCCWQEGGLEQTVAEGLELVHLLQVSDFVVGTNSFPNRWVPGDGDLPMGRLLRMVLELGYTGIVDLELTGPEVARQGVEVALRRGTEWMNAQLGR